MSPRKHDPEAVIKRARALAPECVSFDELARRMGVSRTSLGRIISSVVEVEPGETLFTAFQRYIGATDIDPGALAVAHELRYFKQRVKALEKELASEQAWHDVLRDVAAMLRSDPIPVPSLPPEVSKKSHHIGMLNVADVHLGAKESANLGLLPWYNVEIAKAAINALFQRTVGLFDRLDYITWDAVIVHFLGDIVEHSDLRRGQRRRVEMGVADQVVEGAYLFAQNIRMLAGKYPKVYVTGVPGNHGRIFQKPGVAAPWDNFDWLMYKLLEALLANQPNVTCLFPRCWYMFHVLYGSHVVYSMHGEDIRSYVGYPWYGYGRAIADIVGMMTLEAKEALRDLDFEGQITSLEQLISLMLVPDTVVIGHHHQKVLFKLFSTNAVGAASMIPVTEFTAKGRRKTSEAAQTLCLFSKSRGGRLVTTYSIWLDDVVRDMSRNRMLEAPVMRVG